MRSASITHETKADHSRSSRRTASLRGEYRRQAKAADLNADPDRLRANGVVLTVRKVKTKSGQTRYALGCLIPTHASSEPGKPPRIHYKASLLEQRSYATAQAVRDHAKFLALHCRWRFRDNLS